MNNYTIYCSKEQTKRAYKLGAPIEEVCTCESPHEYYVREGLFIVAPTAEQMRGWLRSKGLHIQMMIYGWSSFRAELFKIDSYNDAERIGEAINSYEKSLLAMIDVALDVLEEGGNK